MLLGTCPSCLGVFRVEGGRLTHHPLQWTMNTTDGPVTTTRPCPGAGGPPINTPAEAEAAAARGLTDAEIRGLMADISNWEWTRVEPGPDSQDILKEFLVDPADLGPADLDEPDQQRPPGWGRNREGCW
jgi:hypothetical protein